MPKSSASKTSVAATPTATPRKAGRPKGKAVKKNSYKSYSRFIHALIRKDGNGKPIIRTTEKAMSIFNAFVEDILGRLMHRCQLLREYAGHKTLRASHIVAAVKLIFPPDLSAHLLTSSGRALSVFNSAGK
ncbi:Histone H2B [Diplonema papillatum]|nr:Histone H2B [Diplonema papillatum]